MHQKKLFLLWLFIFARQPCMNETWMFSSYGNNQILAFSLKVPFWVQEPPHPTPLFNKLKISGWGVCLNRLGCLRYWVAPQPYGIDIIGRSSTFLFQFTFINKRMGGGVQSSIGILRERTQIYVYLCSGDYYKQVETTTKTKKSLFSKLNFLQRLNKFRKSLR